MLHRLLTPIALTFGLLAQHTAPSSNTPPGAHERGGDGAVAAREDGGRLIVDDTGASYPVVVDLEATLVASDVEVGDGFGGPLALSDNVAIVGATWKNNKQGAAYIFSRDGTTWTQQAELTVAGSYLFGQAIAVSGETAIVASDSGNARAYVYVRSGSSWSLQAVLASPTPQGNDQFAQSVAVSGDTAIVGAYGQDSYTGAAFVYVRTGTSWTYQATLTAPDRQSFDHFGNAVVLEGDTALVGAFFANNLMGASYVFVRSGTSWTYQGKLTPSDMPSAALFGAAIALSGDTAVVGTIGGSEPNFYYGAYVYQRNGSTWTEAANLARGGGGTTANSGAVAISGNRVLVAGWQMDGTPALYVFAEQRGTWIARGQLPMSGGPALSGDTALVGTGTLQTTGAVYVYRTPCTIGLSPAYTNNTLDINYSIRTAEALTWSTWLVEPTGVKLLWTKPLPVIGSPRTGTAGIPNFPPSGKVGIFSRMSTDAGPACAAFQTVDTGGAGLSSEEIESLAQQAGLELP